MGKIGVLFVCYGNICRSPMAEFVFRRILDEEGLADRFNVASAATSGEHIGDPVDARAAKELMSHGISCEGKRGRRLIRSDYLDYDYIVGMDRRNMEYRMQAPPGAHTVRASGDGAMSDIRVFISIPIPDRSPLEPLSEMLGSMRNTRPSPIDQVHITLRFIGDIDESRIDDIEDCVRRAADGIDPFTVRVSGVGAFPREDRPSVVWVGASPWKELALLADRIGRNLDDTRIPYDRKPFKPHITIARCKGPADLSAFFDRFSGCELLDFECDRVLVMRSVLGPRGATHSVLREIALRSGRDP